MAKRSRVSVPECTGNVLTLTSNHLSTLPKRNNELFILAYTKGQQAFLKEWASDGRTDTASWDQTKKDSARVSHLPISSGTPNKLGDPVFGSPVLKARVPELVETIEIEDFQSKSRNQMPSAVPQPSAKRASKPHESKAKYKKSGATMVLRTIQPDTLGKRNKASSHHLADKEYGPENEHDDRLAERRHRKRIKKDIMKPATKDDTDREEKASERKKTKGQTSFALMHGFAATNVGKNRLTLDHLSHSTGVFKKGKASISTTVPKGALKQKKPENHFSESKFLKTKASAKYKVIKTSEPQSFSSSADSISSSHTHKTTGSSNSSHTKRSSCLTAQSESKQSSQAGIWKRDGQGKPHNPADSIIWDIEKDLSATSESASGSDARQGTILVKVPNGIGSARSIQNSKEQGDTCEDMNSGKCACPDRISTLSLGPSQSASQVKPSTSKNADRENVHFGTGVSRYFNAKVGTVPSKLFDKPNTVPHSCNRGSSNADMNVFDTDKHDHLSNDLEYTSVNLAHCLDVMDAEEQINPPMLYDDISQVEYVQESDEGSCFWSQVIWDNNSHEELYPVDQVPSIDFCMASVHMSDVEGKYESAREHENQILEDTLPHDLIPHLIVGDFEEGDYSIGPQEDDHETAEFGLQDNCIWPDGPLAPVFLEVEGAAVLEGSIIYLQGSQENTSEIPEYETDDRAEPENFSQGRTILYGLDSCSRNTSARSDRLMNAEVEVAGILKENHWLPQRF